MRMSQAVSSASRRERSAGSRRSMVMEPLPRLMGSKVQEMPSSGRLPVTRQKSPPWGSHLMTLAP